MRFSSMLPSFIAWYISFLAIDRGDIEFTVCELNCHNAQQEDQSSPVFERKPRFSSFKNKSGGISKAVRNKLNLSKSSAQPTEKQNSYGESSSFEHEKLDHIENGSSKDNHETSSSSSSKLSKQVTKKKSKLCLLLWQKDKYSEDHV